MTPKACPVALHPDGTPRRIAAFIHPSAGTQLVKGGFRPGEAAAPAAARELFEESGLETVTALALGESDEIASGERWHFVLCRLKPPVREAWQHLCADDGGQLFRFFWHPIEQDLSEAAEPYQKALHWIRAAL